MRKKLIKKLDESFSRYIRLSHATSGWAVCFTCGKTDHWTKLQAGHFITRLKHSTRWDDKNVQPQCVGCNMFKGGEQYKFGVKLDQVYGEGTAAGLLLKSNKTVKFSNQDLIDMEKKYREIYTSLSDE